MDAVAHRTSVVHPGDLVDGRYRVREVIAEGGMGTVFLAEHTRIKRQVALKVLHPELASDVDMIRRFLNEASAAGTLGHPNIVESTDMGFTPENVPFIVFEYLQGSVLTEEIYRVRGLPVRRAVRIARQIASALEAAHNADIIHLDLKSDNILLVDRDSPDHVKVLDFGISKFMEPDPNRTQRSVIMGTPEFMSPEQITMPDDVDARSDIYSLGVVLYEMLTARRPYGDESPRLLLHRIVHETPPALDRAGVPPELERILFDRMLAKDPADRFSSMKEVHDALATFDGGRAADSPLARPRAVAPPDDPLPARVVRLPPAPAPRWPVSLLLAAALAGMAGGGLWFAERRVATSIDEATVHALEGDAAQLGAHLEASVRSARQRAEGLAGAPIMRAAIETDAATIADLVEEQHLFAPGPGEILQIFQVRDGDPTSVLRLPAESTPLAPMPAAHGSLIELAQQRLRVIATAPITRTAGATAGTLTIAAPVDLTSIRARLAGDALGASLVGLAEPLELLPPATGDATAVSVPVPLSADLASAPLTLHATVRPTERGKTLRAVRYASWGFGGLMLIGFVGIGAVRSRR